MKIRAMLALTLLVLGMQAPLHAQNLPGTVVLEASVNADVRALFTLAAQAYPTVFTQASDWRTHGGYTYKFFAGSGIYAGVKDGTVYLLGGPFGTTIMPKGQVASAVTALQKVIDNAANAPKDLGNIDNAIVLKTTADIIKYFRSVTMEYSSSFGTVSTVATYRFDVLGTEAVNGVSTDRVQFTLQGNGANQVYELWIDGSGQFQKAKLGSFEYPTAAQAQVLGTSLFASLLISLAAVDNAQVKAAIANQLKSPAVSQQLTTRNIGSMQVPSLVITVSANGATYEVELSDFGSFGMATRLESRIGTTMSSGFEVVDMQLR